MDEGPLREALASFREHLEEAVATAHYNGKDFPDGLAAKTAAIRSGVPIGLLHEVAKADLAASAEAAGLSATMHPPIGRGAPELPIAGLIKSKRQDVVMLLNGDVPTEETIRVGPLAGEIDAVGEAVSNRSIAVGVRSQVSSIDKNFDTLMERAFAEPLNLHARLPSLVAGEVYLLPIQELDDAALRAGDYEFKDRFVRVERFIRTFAFISGRSDPADDPYKYEETALILADFTQDPPALLRTDEALIDRGVMSAGTVTPLDQLDPVGFGERLVAHHVDRHGP
jgi:hypothetical protein